MKSSVIEEQARNKWSQELDQRQLIYPDENVVRFLARNYPDREANGARQAADFGFGSGRHLRTLIDYGFVAHGTELIDNAFDVAKSLVGEHERLGRIEVGDLADRPFPNGFLDVAILWGVVFLRPFPDIVANLRSAYDMLKPGGKVIVNFRTADDWKNGLGTEMFPGTFVLDERTGSYAGYQYTFVTLDQAQDCITEAGFSIDDYERFERWLVRGSQRNSWYHFTITK